MDMAKAFRECTLVEPRDQRPRGIKYRRFPGSSGRRAGRGAGCGDREHPPIVAQRAPGAHQRCRQRRRGPRVRLQNSCSREQEWVVLRRFLTSPDALNRRNHGRQGVLRCLQVLVLPTLWELSLPDRAYSSPLGGGSGRRRGAEITHEPRRLQGLPDERGPDSCHLHSSICEPISTKSVADRELRDRKRNRRLRHWAMPLPLRESSVSRPR
jgi:hypothetical protein